MGDMDPFLDTLRDLGRARVVVEIGTRSGVSAAAFLSTCSHLTTIDVAEHTMPASVAANSRLTIVRGSSHEVDLVPCEVLLIDGDHSYAAVAKDLERWSPVVSRCIAMHDTHCKKLADVRRAMEDFLAKDPGWMVQQELPSWPGMTLLVRR